ncbi:MAG: protease inhibitor I9 family protein [Cypionkella sp.]|nr:protease inhibitor I9 family protein [Cypionkella sp.]
MRFEHGRKHGANTDADTGADSAVTLLMQKLAQIKDDAAIAALGPPPSPIVLPDDVLSALVPNQFILTLAEGGADFSTPEQVASAFGLNLSQIRYVYSRVLRGFSANITSDQAARLAADPRIADVAQDGFVFPAQQTTGQALAGPDSGQLQLLPLSVDSAH